MASTVKQPRITLLSGPRGSGKTTRIQRLIVVLKNQGSLVYGVACPKVVKGGRVTGIFVVDAESGEKRTLAIVDDQPGIRLGPWRFLGDGIAFGNKALHPRPGLCVFDEVGPLELSGGGFSDGWEALCSGWYEKAIVVVRPELVEKVRDKISGRVRIVDMASGDELIES